MRFSLNSCRVLSASACEAFRLAAAPASSLSDESRGPGSSTRAVVAVPDGAGTSMSLVTTMPKRACPAASTVTALGAPASPSDAWECGALRGSSASSPCSFFAQPDAPTSSARIKRPAHPVLVIACPPVQATSPGRSSARDLPAVGASHPPAHRGPPAHRVRHRAPEAP